MLLSPETYILQFKNYSYEDLLVVRDELIDDIQAYENGNIHPKTYFIKPGPEEIYQMNLEYLSEICKLIRENYRRSKSVEFKKINTFIPASKEDLEEDSVIYKLLQIQKLLSQYNIESEIRDDRKGGPYINIGKVESVKDRVQFWCRQSSNAVDCWVGRNMSPWFSVAFSSDFRKKWRYEEKEYYLSFDKLLDVDDYIRVVDALS